MMMNGVVLWQIGLRIGKNKLDMRFEIPFTDKIYREQSELYFNSVWKKFLNENKKVLYIAIPMIIMGIATIYGKNSIGYLFIIMGLFLLYLFYKNRKKHIENKKKYFENVEKNILEYSLNNKPSNLEFHQNYFHYLDFKLDLKVKWNSFTKFSIIDKNLFLELNDNLYCLFFVGEEEVGEENFAWIIHFLEEKIKSK
jgi:c-di-AMP phosphodiesterase-like protein